MVPGGDRTKGLDLPEEVSTLQAAAILGCCKHTVLQYLADGLLEWRDAAPPSSARPVYRFTLRSVLVIRLGYKTSRPAPAPKARAKPRKRTAAPTGYRVKHLRRKGPDPQE